MSACSPRTFPQVLLRGGIIFGGYLKLESTTKEVLEPDGWFHTGDIGEILPDGSLKIIDRKKNIFKLSQGEYIAVEKVEAAFGKSDFVDTVRNPCYGDGVLVH